MNISIQAVTKENYQEILKLRVAVSQSDYIETPMECLTEATECEFYKPVGLYSDDELVGFAMYGFFPNETKRGRLWIDRILIDSSYQGKGLGTLFMEALIEKVEEEYGKQPIFLSVYPDNKGAIHLYDKLGFVFTDEFDINGESIMVRGES